ncbi:MAG: hypothetical protein HOQ14_12430, partial [Gemmatimonadaceae bacterium]|nr:hypothetical protein [Gemmatimonadaceae bacterium]
MKLRTHVIAALVVTSVRLPAQSAPLPRSTPEREGIPSSAILSFVQAADSSIDAM